MVAYNFQKRFAPAVESGQKTQTIRALGKRRHARPGDTLQLYTGMRSTSCRKLREATCDGADPVLLTEGDWFLGGPTLTPAERVALARADGFESVTDFLDFFRDAHGLPFRGVLIRWRL